MMDYRFFNAIFKYIFISWLSVLGEGNHMCSLCLKMIFNNCDFWLHFQNFRTQEQWEVAIGGW